MSKEIVRVCPPFVMTFSKLDYHDRVAGGILNCPPLYTDDSTDNYRQAGEVMAGHANHDHDTSKC